MANSKDKERALALELYLTGKYTQKEIAEFVSVTEKTICVWADAGRWEALRAARQSTPGQVAANMLAIQKARTEQILEQVRQGTTDKFGDEMLKMAQAIEKLQGSMSLSTIIQVLQDFMGFVGGKDHAFRAKLATFQSEFLNFKNAQLNG